MSLKDCYDALVTISSTDLESESARHWVDSRWITFLRKVTSSDCENYFYLEELWSRCARISGAINDE